MVVDYDFSNLLYLNINGHFIASIGLLQDTLKTWRKYLLRLCLIHNTRSISASFLCRDRRVLWFGAWTQQMRSAEFWVRRVVVASCCEGLQRINIRYHSETWLTLRCLYWFALIRYNIQPNWHYFKLGFTCSTGKQHMLSLWDVTNARCLYWFALT